MMKLGTGTRAEEDVRQGKSGRLQAAGACDVGVSVGVGVDVDCRVGEVGEAEVESDARSILYLVW